MSFYRSKRNSFHSIVDARTLFHLESENFQRIKISNRENQIAPFLYYPFGQLWVCIANFKFESFQTATTIWTPECGRLRLNHKLMGTHLHDPHISYEFHRHTFTLASLWSHTIPELSLYVCVGTENELFDVIKHTFSWDPFANVNYVTSEPDWLL